jgi:DNA-binding transcriptional regulator YhcF (GntR family)
MVEMNEYVNKLLDIQGKKLISKCDLAREIGVNYNTLVRILNEDADYVFAFKTMRKIKAFIEKHKMLLEDIDGRIQ